MEEHYLNVNDKNFNSSDGFSILYRIVGYCLIFIIFTFFCLIYLFQLLQKVNSSDFRTFDDIVWFG